MKVYINVSGIKFGNNYITMLFSWQCPIFMIWRLCGKCKFSISQMKLRNTFRRVNPSNMTLLQLFKIVLTSSKSERDHINFEQHIKYLTRWNTPHTVISFSITWTFGVQCITISLLLLMTLITIALETYRYWWSSWAELEIS